MTTISRKQWMKCDLPLGAPQLNNTAPYHLRSSAVEHLKPSPSRAYRWGGSFLLHLFMVMKQDETEQWNTLKHHETVVNHLETVWNSAMQHLETAWNSTVKHLETPWNRIEQSSETLWNTMKHIQGISLPWNSVFHDHETHCFILIQGVSWLWHKMFHCDSSWFKLFHNHETHCFILNFKVFMTTKQNVSSCSTCFTVFADRE